METKRCMRVWVVVVAMTAMCVLAAAQGYADHKVWNDGSSSWSTGSNWTGGEPTNSDSAGINNGGTAAIGSGEVCTYLYLGTNANESGYISMTTGDLAASGAENIGNSGTGTFTQSGGTNSTPYVYVAGEAGSSGQYNLSGTGVLSVSSYESAGWRGTGGIAQSGGTNTSAYLYLGYVAGSTGTYDLSGAGSLTVTGYEMVGNFGVGVFTQTGGTNTTPYINFTDGTGSTGIYNLNYGTLTVNNAILDGSGTSTLNIDGGTLNGTYSSIAVDNFHVGFGADAVGSLTLNSNATLTVKTNMYVGTDGTGTFNQSGGTTTAPYLHLGTHADSSGTYNLSGGTLSVSGWEEVGYQDDGIMSQSGGSNTTPYLYLGYYSGSSGAYNLSGTGSLTVTGYEMVSNLGAGIFTQTGGTHSAQKLYLGYDTGSNGTYNLNGGTLSVGSGSVLNGSGTGTFNINGGTLNGSYTALGVDNFNIGTSATGSYTMSGKNVTVGTLGIGASGTYIVESGTLNATTVNSSSGTFKIDGLSSAYTLNLPSSLTFNKFEVGNTASKTGSYTLSAGSLTAATMNIGGLGTGTMNQTGGTSAPGGLTVGANGTYNLSAGTLDVGASNIGGTGILALSGTGNLDIADTTGSNTVGTFNMSAVSLNGTGKTLTATTYGLSGGTVNANLGAGTVNVTTGTVTLNGTEAATAVNVNSGTLSLGDNDRLIDTATVTVAGGILDTTASNRTDTVGIFNMSSGSLNGGGTITAGTYGLTGGTVNAKLGAGAITVNGTVGLGSAARLNSASTLALQGGQLTLAGAETVSGYTQTGGTLAGTGNTLTSTSAFDMRVGSVSAILGGTAGLTKSTSGTLTLSGINTYSGTTLVSEGTLALTGAGSIANSSLIDVASGATFDTTGLAGGFTLGSAQTIKGSGALTGDLTIGSGSIIAPGNSPGTTTVNGDFTLLGTYEAELGGTGAGEYDKILVYGGDVVLGSGSTIKLIPWLGFTPTIGNTFTLIDWDDGRSFSNLGYTLDTSLFGPANYWTFTQNGSSLKGEYNGGVPEPSSMAVSGIALGLFGLIKRMRRKPETRD